MLSNAHSLVTEMLKRVDDNGTYPDQSAKTAAPLSKGDVGSRSSRFFLQERCRTLYRRISTGEFARRQVA